MIFSPSLTWMFSATSFPLMWQSCLYFTTLFLRAQSVVCTWDFQDGRGHSGHSTCDAEGSGPKSWHPELAEPPPDT